MTRPVLLSGLIVLTAILSIAEAPAEDRGAWFKSLKQPGTGNSCCDISDCRRTEANWREGRWWAKIADEWTPVPPNRELDKKSIDGEAYVCANPDFRIIYCFIRPTLAM